MNKSAIKVVKAQHDDKSVSFINTFAQILMALHDKLNVANNSSDLKHHDDNRYKTAVVSRICLCLLLVVDVWMKAMQWKCKKQFAVAEELERRRKYSDAAPEPQRSDDHGTILLR